MATEQTEPTDLGLLCRSASRKALLRLTTKLFLRIEEMSKERDALEKELRELRTWIAQHPRGVQPGYDEVSGVGVENCAAEDPDDTLEGLIESELCEIHPALGRAFAQVMIRLDNIEDTVEEYCG